MNEINREDMIARLLTMLDEMKADHMASDIMDDVTEEERAEYRANYDALSFAFEVLVTNHFCSECEHFLGCGDWNLCCSLKNGLCYKGTAACEHFIKRCDKNY